MNSAITLCCFNNATEETTYQKNFSKYILKFNAKNERKLLKLFLLGQLYQLFYELFHNKIKCNQNSSMEYYMIDSKIIQLLIQGIIETEQYTLEGIAFYTRIPFDVIYDIMCGISRQFSITLWARIVDLYITVKPDIEQALLNKLFEMKEKNFVSLFSLLT